MTRRLSADRTLLILLGCALVARLVFSIPVFINIERSFACTDAVAYDRIARNLLDGHGFSKSPEPPYKKDSVVTPAYPFFLAGIYTLFGRSRLAVVFIQIIMNLVVLAILYRFLAKRFGSKPALWMGVLFIADLNMALFSAQLTSEALFTFLFIPALILILDSFEGVRLTPALAAGALLGAATLVRPIAIYFGVPLFVFLLLTRFKWRKLLQWGVILLIQIAFITPWIIRNRVVFGETFYTTVSDVNFLLYHAAPLKAALERKPRGVAQQELEDEVFQDKGWQNQAQYFRILGRHARRYLLKHPLPYVGSVVMGGVIVLVSPLPMSGTGIYFRGKEALPELEVAQSSMIEILKGRAIPALKIALRERLRYFGVPLFTLFIAYALFHLFKLGCGLRAYILRGLRDPALLLFLLTGLYFMGLVCFGTSPRMRAPIEPLLVSLAGIGLTSKRIKKSKDSKEAMVGRDVS